MGSEQVKLEMLQPSVLLWLGCCLECLDCHKDEVRSTAARAIYSFANISIDAKFMCQAISYFRKIVRCSQGFSGLINWRYFCNLVLRLAVFTVTSLLV